MEALVGFDRAGYDFKRLFILSEYYDRDRPAFYRAIQSGRERDMDLTGWIECFSQGLATQFAYSEQTRPPVLRSNRPPVLELNPTTCSGIRPDRVFRTSASSCDP